MNVNELIIKLLHLPNQMQEVTPELLEAAGAAKEKKILFLCNRNKECGVNGCAECRHTSDVEFAENFTKFSEDLYMEYNPEAYRKERKEQESK